MPCRSEYDDEPTVRIVDNVTNLLCTVVHVMQMKLSPHLYNAVLNSSTGLPEWINEHQKVDETRWVNYYRNQYSNFSTEEILKMIKEGINNLRCSLVG